MGHSLIGAEGLRFMAKRKGDNTRYTRTWKTLNVSWDTYDNMRKVRKPGEPMNNLVRRMMRLPVPDPTRPLAKRKAYYDEDWGKV